VLLLAIAALAASESPSFQHRETVEWQAASSGVDRALVDVSGKGEGWATRILALRVDPARLRFRLRTRLSGAAPGWTVDEAPDAAVVAVNAGQFSGSTPWGWVVMEGKEIRPPGRGPLSASVAWDTAGRVRWLDARDIERHRATGEIVEAFQSYPTLLDGGGEIPRALTIEGLGIDVDHHDARLAIGLLPDGRLLLALTRFHGLGALSPPIPVGLTLAEMADVMRRFGCIRAVSLDGGVSAQLLLNTNGRREVWRGWRNVPLGLVAEPRDTSPAGHDRGSAHTLAVADAR
jgi:exopolysaccharide biosynthesis protein